MGSVQILLSNETQWSDDNDTYVKRFKSSLNVSTVRKYQYTKLAT